MIRNVILLASLPLLGGCWLTNAYLWAPYQGPAPSHFQTTSPPPGCPRIGVQNLNREDEAAIREAVSEVCRIYHSPEFAAEVRARSWLATCERPAGRPDTVSGDYVVSLLTGPIDDFSVLARKPIAAVAQIDPPNARIAVRKRWFALWRLGGRDNRQWLVGTMAHEMSHFVRQSGETRFRDGGHSGAGPGCPDADLVSYGVGELARRIWYGRQPG